MSSLDLLTMAIIEVILVSEPRGEKHNILVHHMEGIVNTGIPNS